MLTNDTKAVFEKWVLHPITTNKIEKSVFIGETDNIGKRTEVWDNSIRRLLDYPRSLVMPWDPKYPIQGFIFYDGSVYLDSVWFDKFTPTENYTIGALSFKKKKNLAPSGGNCVYDGDETEHRFNNLDGDKMATFRDEDGSVTNLATIQQIVKPGLFYTMPSCIYRKNWKMAICPYKYAKLNIKIDASSPEHGQTESIMVRDDQPDSPETLTGVKTNEFLTILGGTHSYTLHWSNGIPRKFAIYTKGVELNQYVRVGMCMPSDATFNLFTRTPLRRLKLVDWTEGQMSTDTRTLAATDPTPPKGWGAGSQLPFTSRIPVNGGWSSWSAFEECSVTCGAVNGKFSDWGQWSSCIVNSGCQGYRERERSCNTPAPQHGGIHCTGSVEKQEACNNCT
ncbi:CEMIP [Mytilus edulis]|uniref:CEMIP n=1 Tax=Mytilus edulis TaxID=6550 RepID=A0A8S3QZ79_MYTED|nr:CEMIP [Mytilus edulis]